MTAYHDYITTQFTEYRCGGNVRFTAFPTFSGQSTATLARTSQSSSIIIVPGDNSDADAENPDGGLGAEVASVDGAGSSKDDPESDDSGKAAIVGGVVGGLGVVAFLILGLITLLLRHRRLKSHHMLEAPTTGQRELKMNDSNNSLHNQIAMHWHGRRINRGADRSRGYSGSSGRAILKNSQEINEAP